MKVSAALQILTTVMSGTATADDWTTQHVQAGDFAPRADLDLGACLDVETLEELSQNLYNDADAQPENTWVENVIDMTSSGELTSSGDHAGIVPNLRDISTDEFALGPSMSATENFDFGFMDGLTATDNASFITLDVFTSAAEATSLDESSGIQDISHFGSLSSAPLTTTVTTSTNSNTTTSTIDLTSLDQLMAMDVDTSSKQSLESTGSGSNIPNTLWNLDLAFSASGEELGDKGLSASAASPPHQGIKETLKNRLHSRGSINSVSQDSNDVITCSTRSLSSSTSSLTLSFEEDELDDPVKALEKKEKNRLAAQKCRNKKRDKAETLQKNVSRLEERQERLKEEVQKLRDERETLEEIINVHGIICPKIRKISDS